jgi:hypothetical protein
VGIVKISIANLLAILLAISQLLNFAFMTQPTIQDFFGAGATQTATTIVIQKADLSFSATANNNGEQCAAAILKKMQVDATKSKFDLDADRNIFIEPGYIGTQYRTVGNDTQTLIDTPLTVHFARVANDAGIDPDSY